MNDLVKNMNGVAFAESQDVAERFGKKHRNVLQSIDRIIEDLTAVTAAVKNYFVVGSFVNPRNREYRNYMMTREGFALVAMTLEGPESMKFKVLFIDAFFRMEATLKKQAHARSIGIEMRKTLTDRILESGENERMKGHGYSTYTKLAYKMIGVKYVKPGKGQPPFRDILDPETLDRLETVEGLIQSMLKLGKQYSEVKESIEQMFLVKIVG